MSDMEYESSRPVDEMENTHTATAQPPVSRTSISDSKDKHEPLSFSTIVADAMETSTPTPIADPLHHIIYEYPLDDDSGIENSASELTDTERTIQEETLAHILPAIPHDPHIPTNTQTSIMNVLQSDSIAAGQSHTSAPQIPSPQEDDIHEIQDDTHYDADSAYDADSIRDDDTETLASFITNYRWENGRRYHAYSDGAYWVWLQKQSEDYLY